MSILLEKKTYSNGQKVFDWDGTTLTYYFKNGEVKAKGQYINEQMEGEWLFYRESGQLWQVGNFKNGKKHGTWKRYSKENRLEYEQEFVDGKPAKK